MISSICCHFIRLQRTIKRSLRCTCKAQCVATGQYNCIACIVLQLITHSDTCQGNTSCVFNSDGVLYNISNTCHAIAIVDDLCNFSHFKRCRLVYGSGNKIVETIIDLYCCRTHGSHCSVVGNTTTIHCFLIDGINRCIGCCFAYC